MKNFNKTTLKIFSLMAIVSFICAQDSLISKVQCGDSIYYCDAKETCCSIKSSEWGCCPYSKATCCEDGENCCPEHYKCNVKKQECEKDKDFSLFFLFDENSAMNKLKLFG